MALHQFDFLPLSPGQVQTQQIKVTVPSPLIPHPTVTMIPKEVVPGHIIETIDIIIGVIHDALTPVLIVPTVPPTLQNVFTQELITLLLGPQQVMIPFSKQTK